MDEFKIKLNDSLDLNKYTTDISRFDSLDYIYNRISNPDW